MTQKTGFIFFGTPEFAAAILEKLIDSGFVPEAVVCNPDRPVGRKKIVAPPPVKSLVLERGPSDIQIIQPEKLDEDFRLKIAGLSPDFFIVAAYAKIISKEIIGIPRLGAIGVHPSLLPKHRGSSPIQTAILNGDTKTGVTLYLLDEKVDHGPIVSSTECELSTKEGFQSLLTKLAELGGGLLVKILPKFLNGQIEPQLQNEAAATYTKKFITEDGFVAPEDLSAAASGSNPEMALAIERKIRALNPEPGVWTVQNAKRTKLLQAMISEGKLLLKKIQIEGEKPQSRDFSSS